jgi:uncharacterized protein (UPF0332 family)
MAFAEDLLEQANHLAKRERTKPKQASLRRAVSTSYYALFHLLVRDGVSNWKRSGQRAELARTFDHGRMRKASQQVANRKFPDHPPQAVANLKSVAKAFDELQELRHLADYDESEKWTRERALDAVNLASAAFQAWQAAKAEDIAQDYLLQLLIQRR